MAGRKSKDKGYRFERKLVELHKDEVGVQAERVPLSGAAGGSYVGDVIIDGEFVAEVKARKEGQGFQTIERWMSQSDMLFLFRDRRPPLVCMDWETYKRIMSPRIESTEEKDHGSHD